MKLHTFVCVAAVAVTLCAIARADTITVRVNGEPVRFYGVRPHMVDGHVMVPMRGVLEQLGATIDWRPDDNTVLATRGDTSIKLPIGSSTAYVNGREIQLDAPAMTISGRAMVPLRFMSEALGANVMWEESTQTVMIDSERTFNAYQDDHSAKQRAARADTVVPAGTVITGLVGSRLSSAGNAAGDQFTVTVDNSADASGLPSGTTIEGFVREARPIRGRRPGLLDVGFRHVRLPDGDSLQIDGSLMSLDGKHVTHTSSGRMVAKADHRGDRMKWVGIGAGAGLLISALAGGDALIDSVLGAGSGYLYNELQHRKPGNVVIREGTKIGIRLDRDLVVPGGSR